MQYFSNKQCCIYCHVQKLSLQTKSAQSAGWRIPFTISANASHNGINSMICEANNIIVTEINTTR